VLTAGATPVCSSDDITRAARTAFISPAVLNRLRSSLGGAADDDRARIRILALSRFAVSPMIFIAAMPASDTSMPFASITFADGKLMPTLSPSELTVAPSASRPGFSVVASVSIDVFAFASPDALSAAADRYFSTSAFSLSRSAIATSAARRSSAIADWLLPTARSIFEYGTMYTYPANPTPAAASAK
jgi:hypothetical protein